MPICFSEKKSLIIKAGNKDKKAESSIPAKKIARKIKAGQTIINKKSRGSAPAPFGGFKMSGNGREHGLFGLEEYLEIKAII